MYLAVKSRTGRTPRLVVEQSIINSKGRKSSKSLASFGRANVARNWMNAIDYMINLERAMHILRMKKYFEGNELLIDLDVKNDYSNKAIKQRERDTI